MWGFYSSLVRDIPRVLRGTPEAWMFWALTIAAPVAVAIVPSLQLSNGLSQISRWLILVPVAVSFCYAMLRVNYQKHLDAQRGLQRVDDYESARREFGAIRTALGHYLTAFVSLQEACLRNPDDLPQHSAFLTHQISLTRDFVSQHFDGGDASLFTSAHLDIEIDPSVERQLRSAPETLRIYRIAGGKAKEIRRLLESTRPQNAPTEAATSRSGH